MKTFVSLMFALYAFCSVAQPQAQFIAPYFENFDSNFDKGVGASNFGSTIDSNWSRTNYPFNNGSIVSTKYFWGGGTGASSTQNSGPSADHTSGNGNYVYAESNNYNEERAKLVSPAIDLDTLSNPQLTFWKHQFGSDIQSFSVQIVANGFWLGTKYFSSGSQLNQWEKVTIPLTNYIGQTVSFIFVAERNSTFPGGGTGLADIAIDDLEVNNPPSCPLPVAQLTDTINSFTLEYDAINSTGLNLSYDWLFGDGNSSTSVNGAHTYGSPGIYNLKLIITDHCGQKDTLQKQVTICDTAISNFTYSKNGSSVAFDASSAMFSASQYNWDFGDGNTGTGKNVSHTYSSSGSYLVTLSLIDLCGNVYSISEIITSCANPEAIWTYQILSSSSAGMLVQFFGQNSKGAQNYFWDFGDGTTSTSSSIPSHTYSSPSLLYNVTLVVTNSCGESDTSISSLQALSVDEEGSRIKSVYPNPAKDVINIDLESLEGEKLEYTIHNLLGEQLMRGSFDFEQSPLKIQIGDFNSGTYILKFKTKKKSFSTKFYKL